MFIKTTRIVVFCMLAGMFSIPQAVAEERHIHVNGAHLNAFDIAALDQLEGRVVPNGFYWINWNNGAWGYEGNNQTQGYLAASGANSASSTPNNERPSIYNDGYGNGAVFGSECGYVTVGGVTVKSC